MKAVGIIAEYNPFHNGHAYLIKQARKQTDADAVIVIMSGSFVQRGEPAIFDKYTRTRAALACGADLVLELPVWCATASAELFAAGAVAQLTAAGCDFLCFGSECGNLSLLQQVAKLLAEEPPAYRDHLQTALRTGLSYPAAVMKAASHTIEGHWALSDQLPALLSSPNNLLSIEYLKAIYRQHSSMQPVTIQRIGQGYHDTTPTEPYSSASAIRNYLHTSDSDSTTVENQTFSELSQWMPPEALSCIQPAQALMADDFSGLLDYRRCYTDDFTKWAGFSPALSNRLLALEHTPVALTEVAAQLKTKQYTYSHISRALFHMLLDIRYTDLEAAEAVGYTPYLRVLGIRREMTGLLRQISRNTDIPLINKVADALPDRLFQLDLQASHLYRSVLYHKTRVLLPDEYRAGVSIL